MPPMNIKKVSGLSKAAITGILILYSNNISCKKDTMCIGKVHRLISLKA